jgi:dienelactone hydrolase
MGFSRGGTAVLRTAVERLIGAQKLPDGLRYAAFIPTYAGGCTNIFRLVVRPGVFSRAPMLFLHGTADDYTPIQPCQDYADKIRAAGTPVEFVAIEGVHHKFDGDDTRRHFLARATKTTADCPIEIDIDNFQAFDRGTGARLQGEAYNAALKSCRAMGANVEGNTKARDQAASAAVTFLKKVFAL